MIMENMRTTEQLISWFENELDKTPTNKTNKEKRLIYIHTIGRLQGLLIEEQKKTEE